VADNTEANESNEAEANEADEAIVANEADAVEADEDDDANKADLANEADVEAILTDDAVLDEAKADEANQADEADAEVTDAVEVIVTKEIEANVINEIVAAEQVIVIDEVFAVDETILDDAANKAIVVDAANEANEAFVADDADGAVLYFLTKYSAIFAEVKGYFGITAPDNQLGRRSSCSLISKNWYQLDNQLEVVVEKDWFDRPNIEVTINSVNVSLKLVGKLDTTINLELSLNKEFGADCAPSDLSRAALSPKMIEALHSPSECGITLNSTTN
jgi:hypothetical protein